MTDDDAVGAAADRLYAAPPDEFTALRGELVKAADQDDKKAIGALRKPTLSASVVNRYVHSDPDVIARLTDLGDRLRQATRQLDATVLRELSTERRGLVAETTRAAFEHVRNSDPPAAQRDEVSASFDAAVADPEIAQRLGRLVRPESFSGFGVVGGPELTLVPGGKGRAAKKTPPAKKPKKKQPARRDQRAAAQARETFEQADERSATARRAEQDARERITALTDELARLQKDLDAAKRDLDRARKDVRATRTERRKAQSALDKAERQLEG